MSRAVDWSSLVCWEGLFVIRREWGFRIDEVLFIVLLESDSRVLADAQWVEDSQIEKVNKLQEQFNCGRTAIPVTEWWNTPAFQLSSLPHVFTFELHLEAMSLVLHFNNRSLGRPVVASPLRIFLISLFSSILSLWSSHVLLNLSLYPAALLNRVKENSSSWKHHRRESHVEISWRINLTPEKKIAHRKLSPSRIILRSFE